MRNHLLTEEGDSDVDVPYSSNSLSSLPGHGTIFVKHSRVAFFLFFRIFKVIICYTESYFDLDKHKTLTH